MFCDQCGKAIRIDAKFCQFCGAKITPVDKSTLVEKISDSHVQINATPVSNIDASLDEALIQYSLRQDVLIRSKELLSLPDWLNFNDSRHAPCARVSIFITDKKILISGSPKKSLSEKVFQDLTLVGRMFGGPLLGSIPQLIGERVQEHLNEKKSNDEWNKIENQEKLIWANRIECTHYECVKKGSFFSEPFSHWCIEGNFYFGESAAKIVLIFGHQEKGGWMHFFQKAGIKPNEIIEIDDKVLITEKFPQYPIPAISKKDLDNIDF